MVWVEQGPCAAERARTTLAHAGTLAVRVTGYGPEVALSCVHDVHAVEDDGAVLVMTAADGALAAAAGDGRRPPCTVEAAVVCPLPGPDRSVDPVRLIGTVEQVVDTELSAALDALVAAGRQAAIVRRPDASTLVRVVPTAVRLAGEPVDPEAFRRAVPDPLGGSADDTVVHLRHAHAPEIRTLARLLEPRLLRWARAVVPARLDRFGLTLRVELATGGFVDARVEFPLPLGGPDELGPALRDLVLRAARGVPH